eukprot:TRINITY_DN6168_c0_g1_i6.p1 TRINITY_DN6168_c0_g1~~TRINITY_DN6168_c0_g1_i6.p1  ORF type:complete len:280 (+),score=35.28 TRINITY_DN6168_c0_g1_i6:99-842(+)
MTCIADVGKIVNKLVVDGQLYGGLAQAIGLALSEDFEDIKKHSSLKGAGFPYIKQIPDDMELIYVESPRPEGPFGASGVGELPLTCPHAAVINGIYNACGARIRQLPARPEKVLAALKGQSCHELKSKGQVLKHLPFEIDDKVNLFRLLRKFQMLGAKKHWNEAQLDLPEFQCFLQQRRRWGFISSLKGQVHKASALYPLKRGQSFWIFPPACDMTERCAATAARMKERNAFMTFHLSYAPQAEGSG